MSFEGRTIQAYNYAGRCIDLGDLALSLCSEICNDPDVRYAVQKMDVADNRKDYHLVINGVRVLKLSEAWYANETNHFLNFQANTSLQDIIQELTKFKLAVVGALDTMECLNFEIATQKGDLIPGNT